MLEKVDAYSGDAHYEIVLDRTTGRWTSTKQPDEGTFPLVAEADGKRYEIYSDATFAEVEDGD